MRWMRWPITSAPAVSARRASSLRCSSTRCRSADPLRGAPMRYARSIGGWMSISWRMAGLPLLNQPAQRHVTAAPHLDAPVAERCPQKRRARQPEPDRLPRQEPLRARADPGPLEPHRHGDQSVLLGRELERRFQQRIAEVDVLEIDAQLQARGAQPVVVGVEDIEGEIERATRQPDPRNLDFLERDRGLGEMQRAPQGLAPCQGGCERDCGEPAPHRPPAWGGPDASRFTRCHHSIRSLMVFSYPVSVGSYQRAPRSASGRYSCSAYAPA